MTPAQFRALAATVPTVDANAAAAAIASLLAELVARGLTAEESREILEDVLAAEIAKIEAARVATRQTKLAAIRSALGLT